MPNRLLLVLGFTAVVVLAAAREMAPPRASTLGAMGHGPTVVLVHGLGSRASYWFPVARDLARDHRVVLVELPGHGQAAMPHPFTLDQATLMLDRAIADQGDEPVVLVGHSVGGLVAAAEAVRDPRRVRALVLVEAALRPQFTPRERNALLASLDRDWAGTLHDVYLGFGRDSAQGEALYAEAVRVDRAAMRAWIELALRADLSRAAAGIEAPVLAVLAPHSWDDGERWAAVADSLGYTRIPNLTPLRLEGCGHFVMLDRPQELAGAIRRFERASATPNAIASAGR